MVRFFWHVDDGCSAHVPVNGYSFDGDSRCLTVEISAPGVAGSATAMLSLPPCLADGTSPPLKSIGVVIAHDIDASTWQNRLIRSIAKVRSRGTTLLDRIRFPCACVSPYRHVFPSNTPATESTPLPSSLLSRPLRSERCARSSTACPPRPCLAPPPQPHAVHGETQLPRRPKLLQPQGATPPPNVRQSPGHGCKVPVCHPGPGVAAGWARQRRPRRRDHRRQDQSPARRRRRPLIPPQRVHPACRQGRRVPHQPPSAHQADGAAAGRARRLRHPLPPSHHAHLPTGQHHPRPRPKAGHCAGCRSVPGLQRRANSRIDLRHGNAPPSRRGMQHAESSAASRAPLCPACMQCRGLAERRMHACSTLCS